MSPAAVTVGIDLASQPKTTGLCVIAWDGRGSARVEVLARGSHDGAALDDRFVADVMAGRHDDIPPPTKVAIDAPIGWPVDFVRAIADLENWPALIESADPTPAREHDPRQRLLRRATDHWIHREVGKLPLSVSSDKIAYPAMRAAGLLADYARSAGEPVDRTGVTGLICEAYPDPAIRRLGLWPTEELGDRASYKGPTNGEARQAITKRLRNEAPWLTITDEHAEQCVAYDDYLDALICALTGRACELGLTAPPPSHLATEAAKEGWIHLPDAGSLAELP